jgi:hypothetical protein
MQFMAQSLSTEKELWVFAESREGSMFPENREFFKRKNQF